jgi:hypothetical protein
MEPIATYAEARLEGRRSFTLLPDRLVMTGKGLSGEMDLAFDLKTLSPIVGRLRVRSRYFRLGFLLLVLPWCITGLAVSVFGNAHDSQWVVFASSLSFLGLIIVAISVRKIEYARFTSRAGVPVLDISRTAKKPVQFDSFIDAITRQIRLTQPSE